MGDIEQLKAFLQAFASHWIWLSLGVVAIGFSRWENMWGGISARIAMGVLAIFCFVGALFATVSDQYSKMTDVYDQVKESVGKKPRRPEP